MEKGAKKGVNIVALIQERAFARVQRKEPEIG
jgi:hypothetical protein